jgi:general secretion pathway protein L
VILDCESAYVEGSLVHGSRLVSVSQMVADEVDSADRLTNAAKTVLERLVALGRVTSLDNARMVAYGSAASSLESLDVVALPLENAGPESSGAFGAIASALLPVKKTGFEANLVPRRLRYRRNQLQLVPTYILIFLTVVLGILMLIREPYQLMVYAFKLDLDVQKITPDIADVARQEAELNRISEKYRALTGHIRGRDANLEALRDLARVLADAVWLTNYTYQDGALTVTGFAPSATEVQRVLEDSPLFREVTFTSSVTKDATGKDRFTLKAAIEVTR